MDEKQVEKIFKYIKGQFQNVSIHCEVKKELANWHIVAIATLKTPEGSYTVTRRSEDLGGPKEWTNYDIAVYIYSLVHILRHALCHDVFVNPEAPEELEL